MKEIFSRTAAILLLIFGQQGAIAAPGTPWDWRADVLPDQSFDTREQALSAVHALGGKYVLAETVESESIGEYWSGFTYGAKPRPPLVDPFNEYSSPSGWVSSEGEAVERIRAAWTYAPHCPATVVTPTTGWTGWQYWYSGDTTEEIRRYRVDFYPNSPTCTLSSVDTQIFRRRIVDCPTFTSWNSVSRSCELHNIAVLSAPTRACVAMVGNPCSASTGNKVQRETDVALPWITLMRTYQSQVDLPYGGFGPQWTHNYNVRLVKNGGSEPRGIVSGDGDMLPVKLEELIDGSGERIDQIGGSRKWTRADGSSKTFNGVGRLVREDLPDGSWYTFTYDSTGRLTTITHASGRSLNLVYETAAYAGSRIQQVLSGGVVLAFYEYDGAGNLSLVRYADGASRRYHYEQPGLPHHLTGITDEKGERFSTYAYDELGRAISSEHAGGAGRITLVYQADASTRVEDSLGAVSIYRFTNDGYYRKATSVEIAGAIQSWSLPAPTVDFRRRPTQSIDRNGRVTKFEYSQFYDSARGATLNRTRRTEAFGTPRQRVIDTDTLFGRGRLAQQSVNGRITSYTYNNRSQVLTQTHRDVATGLQRTTAFTYCEVVDLAAGCPWVGLRRSIDGPRTDVADVTTFRYDAQGNLTETMNALGHVTTYSSYNAHGQPLTITDPNGVATTLSYDLRQRLTSRTVGAEVTAFSYWPTGLLKQATLPDGSYLEYSYDAAHRLTEIKDAEGHRIVYTLDAMGNRTAEQVYDPSNALTRTRTRVYNTLNQLWKELGAAGTANVTTSYTYDNNGNQTGMNAPLGRSTTQGYDELNRLTQVTDPLLGVTQYGYNALDQLISVSDPRSKTTSYSYNALGDLTRQVSPDTGTTTHTYDAGGNLQTSTDARGKTATYSYDALNRVTGVTYPDQTISYSYDSGTNQQGRLTQITDASGTTNWSYDPQGRVLTRQQSMGISRSVGYAYDQYGRLQTLTLPSGHTLSYGYTNGQVTSLTLNGSTAILSNVLYQPFGPTSGWTWGNTTLHVREYGSDGQVTDLDSAGLKTYGYDDALRITAITDASDPSLNQSYGYDLLDRLTSASGTSLNQGWTYDPNGNRLSQSGSQASSYTIASTNNRISAISGSLNRSYSYDAAGNTTSDGSTTFTYNDAGRLISTTKAGITTTYALNALGQRVKKTANGATTYFVYDEAGHLIGEYDGAGNLIQETVWFRRRPGCSPEAERQRRSEPLLHPHGSSQHTAEDQPVQRQRHRVALGLRSVRHERGERRSGWRLESVRLQSALPRPVLRHRDGAALQQLQRLRPGSGSIRAVGPDWTCRWGQYIRIRWRQSCLSGRHIRLGV